MVSLEEAKMYLRVDDDYEDALIQGLIDSAQALCMDVVRQEREIGLEEAPQLRVALLFAIAYLYEHREEADHQDLTLTLRALLFGIRQEGF